MNTRLRSKLVEFILTFNKQLVRLKEYLDIKCFTIMRPSLSIDLPAVANKSLVFIKSEEEEEELKHEPENYEMDILVFCDKPHYNQKFTFKIVSKTKYVKYGRSVGI